jgi:DNA-binding response OmpR family regulator
MPGNETERIAPVFDFRFFRAMEKSCPNGDGRKPVQTPVPATQQRADEAPVLVVEDDDDIRNLIRLALEEEGLPVETASDGREALTWLDEEKPALVLLDMGLPRVSGEGVAEGIRRRYDKHVPIVVVSAFGSGEQARRVDADAYVPKPFDVGHLMATVHRLLMPVG